MVGYPETVHFDRNVGIPVKWPLASFLDHGQSQKLAPMDEPALLETIPVV